MEGSILCIYIYIYTVYVQTTGYRYTSVLPHETCSMMEHDQLKIEKKGKIYTSECRREWSETEGRFLLIF